MISIISVSFSPGALLVQAAPSQLSYLLLSLLMCLLCILPGPVCSIMVNQFGCRPVMLIGGLLASAGMILASFTTNIIELYLTAGVLTGEIPRNWEG